MILKVDMDMASSIMKVVQEWINFGKQCMEKLRNTYMVGIAINNTQKEAVSSEVIFFVLKLYFYFVLYFTEDIPC